MNTHKRTRIGPVCKFGPGGDFVSVWPRQLKPLFRRSQSRLVRLLGSVGGTIAELFDSELSTVQIESAGVIRDPGGQEKSDYAAEGIDRGAYAATVAGAEGGGRVSSEPMLFPDDWRISRAVEHKPKHRIRTHRRVAKKKPALSIAGQGSLFEADGKSTKTA